MITVAISLAIWSGLFTRITAAEAVIGPSHRAVQVGCRPRRGHSDGRPSACRADLLTSGRRPRRWDWAPVSTQSWNARQWYSPDAEIRLVPPGSSGSWDSKPKSSSSSSSPVPASRSQNWYSPAYHGGSSSPNSSLRHQQYYYSATVADRRVNRTIPSYFVA